jgi:hypothetical protein
LPGLLATQFSDYSIFRNGINTPVRKEKFSNQDIASTGFIDLPINLGDFISYTFVLAKIQAVRFMQARAIQYGCVKQFLEKQGSGSAQ